MQVFPGFGDTPKTALFPFRPEFHPGGQEMIIDPGIVPSGHNFRVEWDKPGPLFFNQWKSIEKSIDFHWEKPHQANKGGGEAEKGGKSACFSLNKTIREKTLFFRCPEPCPDRRGGRAWTNTGARVPGGSKSTSGEEAKGAIGGKLWKSGEFSKIY